MPTRPGRQWKSALTAYQGVGSTAADPRLAPFIPYPGPKLENFSYAPVPLTSGVTMTPLLPFYSNATPTGFSVDGALAPGLSLNTTTGEISGTPTTPGTYPTQIQGYAAGGNTATIVTFVVS